MKSKKEIEQHYSHEEKTLSSIIKRLRHRNKLFIGAELLFFTLSLVLLVLLTVVDGHNFLFIALAILTFAIYVIVRMQDGRNSNKIESLEYKRQVYERELRYLHGDFSHFDNGERFIDPNHEYTFDMDIFGNLSLYNRVCRAVTTGGADCLAKMFANCALSNRTNQSDIIQRREAINELAEKEQWRMDFMSYLRNEEIDTSKLTSAVNAMRQTNVGAFASNHISSSIAFMALIGFWVTVVLSIFSLVSANLPVWWGIIQFAVCYCLFSAPLRTISKIIGQLHKPFKSYVGLIKLIDTLSPQADYTKQLVASLNDNDISALHSFKEMESLIDSVDRRGNILGMIFFNILLLSDFFLVRRFLSWQQRSMGNFQKWIDAVSNIDALVSMATYRHNEPMAVDAEIVDTDKIVYNVQGLYHPFLGADAVSNNFDIADSNYYIVTGANMAGKSTFLRSLGVNYILAMTGMPVFAQTMKVSIFSLFSSMRTSDDLSHGISYFKAELLRLSQLIDSCRKSSHTLIILDEILRGTNSLDKLNGSRMFLQAISSLPVSGVIATHDLELSKMADENPLRFHNYCFEISLSNKIIYSYKITPGVARNQNATYLLKNIIKNI